MLKTRLEAVKSGFKSKHLCPFSQELKSIRTQLDEIADEYGHYSTDLQISISGQAVMYHVRAYNIQLEQTVEVVANNLKDLEEKFKANLQVLKDQSHVILFFNNMFSTMHKK